MSLYKSIPHTFRKEGIYYFNRRVPKDVRGSYNKSRISFSLKTKSLKQAHRSSLLVSQNLESHMCITACHIFLRHFENHQRTL